MILLVSAAERERTAFAALCAHSRRVVVECSSVRSTASLLRRSNPRVVVIRHKLNDGFSDDIIALLLANGQAPAAKIVVLIAAGAAPLVETRQLELGADCVLRDPVRCDVLLAYIAKYYHSYRRTPEGGAPKERMIEFAGAMFSSATRELSAGERVTSLTSREAALLELLVQSQGEVATYETLFSEILGRSFRGETSNMRVLLGKLAATTARLGISMREWVEVVPKVGYRYRAPEVDKSRRG